MWNSSFGNSEEERAPVFPFQQRPATETGPRRVRWTGFVTPRMRNRNGNQHWSSFVIVHLLLSWWRGHKEVLQGVSPHGILLHGSPRWPVQAKKSAQGCFGPPELNQRARPRALGWVLPHSTGRCEEFELVQCSHVLSYFSTLPHSVLCCIKRGLKWVWIWILIIVRGQRWLIAPNKHGIYFGNGCIFSSTHIHYFSLILPLILWTKKHYDSCQDHGNGIASRPYHFPNLPFFLFNKIKRNRCTNWILRFLRTTKTNNKCTTVQRHAQY